MGGFINTIEPEKAVLIGVSSKDQPPSQVDDYLEELAFLVDTAGAIPLKRFIQRLEIPNARTYIGSGKLDEIRDYVKATGLILRYSMMSSSPSQIRNIEKELEIRALDRTNLILDIFAHRAKTAYAKTQVELAQYEYLLPRLTGHVDSP